MKVGDLVKVRYAKKNSYDLTSEGWGKEYYGILYEAPYDGGYTVYQMYCFKDNTVHTLMPELDLIEVISESR
jgi:hypothetical protein